MSTDEQDRISINSTILYNDIRNLIRFVPSDNFLINLLDKLNRIVDFDSIKFHKTLLLFGKQTINAYTFMYKIIRNYKKNFILYFEDKARERDNIEKEEDRNQLKKLISKRIQMQGNYHNILKNKLTSDNIIDVDEYLDNII